MRICCCTLKNRQRITCLAIYSHLPIGIFLQIDCREIVQSVNWHLCELSCPWICLSTNLRVHELDCPRIVLSSSLQLDCPQIGLSANHSWTNITDIGNKSVCFIHSCGSRDFSLVLRRLETCFFSKSFGCFLVIKLVIINEDEHLLVMVNIKHCLPIFVVWWLLSWSVDHHFRSRTFLHYVSNDFLNQSVMELSAFGFWTFESWSWNSKVLVLGLGLNIWHLSLDNKCGFNTF